MTDRTKIEQALTQLENEIAANEGVPVDTIRSHGLEAAARAKEILMAGEPEAPVAVAPQPPEVQTETLQAKRRCGKNSINIFSVCRRCRECGLA